MRPKLHAVTSKDPWREVMQFGLLTKEHIVVTDAMMLVAHKCTSLFDKDFIDTIPEDRGILIPAVTLKEMNKKGVTYSLKIGDVPEMEFSFKGNSYSHKLEYNGVGKIFPQWEAVIPKSFDAFFNNAITFNAGYLLTLAQAINPDNDVVELRSSGEDRAMGVFDPTDTYEGCRAFLMPCMK